MEEPRLSTKDRRALNAALHAILKGDDTARRIQVAEMLKERGFFETARFCAGVIQAQNLNLRPWDQQPCLANPDSSNPAGRLLARMLASGMSRYDIDPMRALAIKAAS